MTWHTTTVPTEALSSLLDRIRTAGGTVACSMPGAAGVRVTWTTFPSQSDHVISRPSARQ